MTECGITDNRGCVRCRNKDKCLLRQHECHESGGRVHQDATPFGAVASEVHAESCLLLWDCVLPFVALLVSDPAWSFAAGLCKVASLPHPALRCPRCCSQMSCLLSLYGAGPRPTRGYDAVAGWAALPDRVIVIFIAILNGSVNVIAHHHHRHPHCHPHHHPHHLRHPHR